MSLSVLDLFKIGIGPSSSHTMGPMWAAHRFLERLTEQHLLDRVAQVSVDLYGSLALTGHGHATDRAIVLGLLGETPDRVDPDKAVSLVKGVRDQGTIALAGLRSIAFAESKHMIFHRSESLPEHPNGLRFSARDECGELLIERVYFSVGGGFVVDQDEAVRGTADNSRQKQSIAYDYTCASELMSMALDAGLLFAGLVRANEAAFRTDDQTNAGLDRVWSAMRACIRRGCREEGILPGGLGIRRRAPGLFRKLMGEPENTTSDSASSEWALPPFAGIGERVHKGDDPLCALDWVSLFALAVNEENAAGGRVVTAPTNGAAGVIPAVIGYYSTFVPGTDAAGVRDFLLTAAAIGFLYKRNASLSAAEVGCQGEVGVACSMAAAGLCAVLGGSNAQVENAAEIGMEHNLGLTCDPIAGLVQVPCIERNTMGATKAINAARLALRGDGTHHVSLDRVIETMRQTGADMQAKYKETSLGGLAVNVVEC